MEVRVSDIVQRLRLIDPNQVLLAAPPHDTSYLQVGLLCHEAAAEIERLRTYLHIIKFQAELARDYVIQLNDDCDAAVKRGKP